MESMIAADNHDAGPCMGIELNVGERAMVGIYFDDIFQTFYINYVKYFIFYYYEDYQFDAPS
jgi:hypothetical protein